ncbi:DUF2510 domain-containing protein [Agrococcus jejuensis]|uniref:DUF2510 domain-containing protein n=1 Tax=Agrococcus jejuensis TaxID=399736 RepID=A0A1G8DJP6_9MICO|nr:DUF2510 domain-containing protein [Agrococcus jejuensis]SDH57862.1 Protein of unknown function [Agrococcus jejuensis]
MSAPSNTAPGWYPNAGDAGTRYWDGRRWSGDTRPPRKTFAAQAAHKGWGIGLTIFGGAAVLSSFTGAASSQSASPLTTAVVGIALLAFGVYLLRGAGPTTKSVETRLAAERVDARLASEAEHQRAMAAAQNPGVHHSTTINVHSSEAEAAQIAAISNPETATALQNLQKLLYSRAITDQEFQDAKDRLLGKRDPGSA